MFVWLCIVYKSSIQLDPVDKYKSFCSIVTKINEEYKLKTEEVYLFIITKKLESDFTQFMQNKSNKHRNRRKMSYLTEKY